MNDSAPSSANSGLSHEADLVDAALALLAHRWLALGIFALCLLIGILWALLMPAHYSYSGAMRIAGLSAATGMQPVSSPQQIEAEMYAFYIPVVLAKYPPSSRPNVTVQIPASSNVVLVSTRMSAAEAPRARAILKETILRASKSDNRLLFSYVGQTKQYLGQQLEKLNALLAKVQRESQTSLKGPDTAAAGVYLSTQTESLINRIDTLQRERDVSLTANIQQAGFGGEIVRSDRPVDLAAWARILIGGLAGLALGIFAALVAQFWHTAHDRLRMRVRG